MGFDELTWEERKARTAAAFDDPQPGDRFTEMLAYYVYVIIRDGDRVVTLDANPPYTLPADGKWREQSLDEFRKRFAYGTIPGYSVTLLDRENETAISWAEVWQAQQADNVSAGIRESTMEADTTQTLDATQANERIPVLIVHFEGCQNWLALGGPQDLLDGDTLETIQMAMEDAKYLKFNEEGEAPILSLAVRLMDKQEFENLEDWYC